MRILISGSRDFVDKKKLFTVLDNEHPLVIIQGGARGADALAKEYAELRGLPCIEIKANWNYYKKAAGPIRNAWMMAHTDPDLVVAFPLGESPGTRDMIKKANKSGVPTLVFEE